MVLRPLLFLTLWYLFSAATLFLNKFILSEKGGDPTLLGTTQMLMTLSCGFVQMYFPLGMTTTRVKSGLLSGPGVNVKPPGFRRHMLLVGTMRFLTVLLGLISLSSIPPSFTETIKSSAPLFTVAISYLLMGERTNLLTNLSLIPVMTGLALCSFNEIHFEMGGFLAALGANFTECLQNVYSKMLISGERYRYSPAQLQFYTSVASTVIQIPTAFLLVDPSSVDPSLFPVFALNGLFFHFQSITAYVLMDYISPVTHSVANTTKRALLILLSFYLYKNEVTVASGLGLIILFGGVVLYNEAKKISNKEPVVFEKVAFSVNNSV